MSCPRTTCTLRRSRKYGRNGMTTELRGVFPGDAFACFDGFAQDELSSAAVADRARIFNMELRRCVRLGTRPTGVIAVVEPGRPLGPDDAERAIDVPVVATVPWDPAVARAVDAGLLVSRLPQTISRPLRGLALGALR